MKKNDELLRNPVESGGKSAFIDIFLEKPAKLLYDYSSVKERGDGFSAKITPPPND